MVKTDQNLKVLAYLLGLITGRGNIFNSSNTIAIEFSHTNEFAEGIAHCPDCGYLATKDGENLKCKNPKCGHVVDKSVKKIYNQPESTVSSIRNIIIPFLEKDIQADYEITGNKSMTLLVINFSKNKEFFEQIKHYFLPDSSFDRFHIPKRIYDLPKEAKIEFINGLLDTSGFPSPGGWLNRDGKNGHGRMRVYFQVVRNWSLPVEIDNFLRSEFSLPIHTIDWGHPNIRDSNLEDFFNTRPTSWSREHQIKFFPEYYGQFKFRISSKEALFQELLDHNVKAVFTEKDDWFPPSKLTLGRIKAYHPGESDIRIPGPARRHFDAFWQINLAMGCKFLKELQAKSKNPDYFALTGDVDTDGNIKKAELTFDAIRKRLEADATNRDRTEGKKVKKMPVGTKEATEQETYAPIVAFLKTYLSDKYKEIVETFDTSSGNLNLFLKSKNTQLLEAFDYCDKFRIRPDVVGFLTKSRRIVFVESKITSLDLKALGQLIGYCLVALPEEAILISTIEPSPAFIKILKARPDLLEYAENKRIQIATLKKSGVNLITI